MTELQTKTREILQWCSEQLHETPFDETAGILTRLSEQVEEPCVVAVTGLVKAGKSTFINALMQTDLAKVGATETTATINYFCYGTPPDPSKPVRCNWRSGREYSWESREFLDSLQGNDLETLKRAANIDRLEFFLPNPVLQKITLVDTPGLGAVVDEHQNRTAEYMALSQQLRNQHDRETRVITEKADAVIFLVGEVARSAHLDFLRAFQEAMGGTKAMAMNALGVMAKVDRDPTILDQRYRLCDKIAAQLKNELNTVVPVSASLQRTLDEFLPRGDDGIAVLQDTLKRIPRELLEEILLSDPDLFEFEDPNCPVSPAERRKLRGTMPWGVFTLLSRTLVSFSKEEAVEKMREYAGFDQLRDVLDRHFFQRGQIIRCHRIIHDAYDRVDQLLRQDLYQLRDRQRQEDEQKLRFLQFLDRATYDPRTAQEIRAFVQQRMTAQPIPQITGRLEQIQIRLDEMLQILIQFNLDFSALQALEENFEAFNDQELAELRLLLGAYGIENDRRVPRDKLTEDYLQERQMAWQVNAYQLPHNHPRRPVAERARDKYGELMYDLVNNGSHGISN